ncbi:hypothetical protein DMENIID0001_035550 [Sergentomyia squamirostris]
MYKNDFKNLIAQVAERFLDLMSTKDTLKLKHMEMEEAITAYMEVLQASSLDEEEKEEVIKKQILYYFKNNIQ